MPYLGNRNTREFHDLSRRTAQCQIDKILDHGHDKAFFPDTAQQALDDGFDPCAWCVGSPARPLSDELLLTRVRAERAESQLAAMTIDRDVTRAIVVARDRELARLREILAAQQAQIAALGERLRAAETTSQQVTLDALVSSLGQALEAGDDALTDRTIVSARADVKAALQASSGSPALVLNVPGTFDPGALSTVSFELRRLPPDAAAQARGAALADIVLAVDALQRALDGEPEPDAAAIAATGALAAAPPASLDAAAAALGAIAGAVGALAQRRAELKDAADGVQRSVTALAAQPAAAAAHAVAAALAQLARDLEGPPS